MSSYEEILSYWFGDLDADPPEPRFELWFGKKPEVDAEIRERFEDDLKRAAAGEYDSWMETARQSLALIILLDQFPRNMYRDDPRSFAFCDQAAAVSEAGLAKHFDRELGWFGRMFYYLPLEHAEDLDRQDQAVYLYSRLLVDAPPALTDAMTEVHKYALRHREIICRFDRFPHRNAVLGRESTPEEIEFLKGPDSSF